MVKPPSSKKIPKYIVLQPERGLIFQHGYLQQSRFQFRNITRLASLWACPLIRKLSKHFKAEQFSGHPSPVAVPASSPSLLSPQPQSPRAPAWILIMQIAIDVSHWVVNSLAPRSTRAFSLKPIRGMDTSPCRIGRGPLFLPFLDVWGMLCSHPPSLSRPPEKLESLPWTSDLRRSLPSLPVQCTHLPIGASVVKNVGFAA